MSKILTKRERIEPLELILGGGEDLPFDNETFNFVLLFHALPYMDIKNVFREIARVLSPGDYLLTTQPFLRDFIGVRLRNAIRARNARLVPATASITANTLWYQYFGSRLRDNVNYNSTARPIYPTKRYLIVAAGRSGLRFCDDQSFQFGADFALVFQRPL
jgi:ubiquinone/menaquinone biosynthesis C-methylase UbiE